MIHTAFFMIPLFLCWGSFLNVVAYRLIHNGSLLRPRSYCPHCRRTLAWYDLIPVLSWLLLKGSCRYCKKSISFLYPLIELVTALSMTMLTIYVPWDYFLGYFIFFSALIVTIRTDLEFMLVSRFVSLFLVPLGILLSFFNLLPLSLCESALGALIGYGILAGIARTFFILTKKEGLGQGDVDLLAFIGSFTGIYGCWISLLIGSLAGSVIGITYMAFFKPNKSFKIPFGPFLALGAMIFVLFGPSLMRILLHLN
ncbi:MAG: prepilin peptidase [Candidatus Dependentiae bacterium]|nr:prepilin peptidase [Candidatus Dependentiae bacterium]